MNMPIIPESDEKPVTFSWQETTEFFNHVEWSSDCAKLFGALAKAQAKISGAVKESKNPHLNSKYANLESVIEALREAFAENGLAQVQHPGPVVDGKLSLVTLITHESGQWMRSYMTADTERNKQGNLTLQELGKAITYMRRYALSAAAGLTQIDDDAHEVSNRQEFKAAPVAQPRPSVPAAKNATGYSSYKPNSQ